MARLRWVKDEGGFWDLDVSTSNTLDGIAVPAPGEDPVPLGISRGTRLSRPKQVEFMHQLLHAPLVPAFSKSNGLSLLRAHTLPLNDDWFVHILGQFNMQKLISSLKNENRRVGDSSWINSFGRQLRDKSVYALGLFSEFRLTPKDVVHWGVDYTNKPRVKAVLRHKFPNHDLTVEAVSPGLFVEKTGTYWDVPFSMAIDVASVAGSDSSSSYHLSAHYNSGIPEPFEKNQNQSSEGKIPLENGEVAIRNQSGMVPPALHPGLAFKNAFSYRKKVDIWRSEASKLKSVQPYDMFLSDPHVSASGTIGAAATTFFGENSARALRDDDSRGFFLHSHGMKSALIANMFASASLTAQYGNFQKRFLDLTRFQADLHIPSGYKFLSGATNLALEFLQGEKLRLEDCQAICPTATLSFQQQIAGPVSFRVDSGIKVDLKDHTNKIQAKEPVFAVEYALQVPGSAKAIAWYCPQRQEFMAELRFLEK